ncbi:N-glycosylation protein-domain-containing protein [Mycena amicta]|nr:N-glycosylation protein-domain-containing protein [Mycena amicta]
MLPSSRVHASLAFTAIIASSPSPPASPPWRNKSASSFDPPQSFFRSAATQHSRSTPSFTYTPPMDHPDSDHNHTTTDEEDDVDVIYTQAARHASTLRSRIFGPERVDTISTDPDRPGAGETETELDEPPCHLPTSRKRPAPARLVPPSTLEQRLTPLLFELSRLLAIVPALIGTLYNIFLFYNPPSAPRAPERIDYLVSALWAMLTGYQCLALTTGLLTRWRVYYPPLATLIRLIALQAICWPTTHISLTLLDHTRRPVAVWAAIGTTTCISRSVQIWVTSNLWDPQPPPPPPNKQSKPKPKTNAGWRRFGGRWGGRRWDWREVGIHCMLPAGVLYFVMAWAEQLRREWSVC